MRSRRRREKSAGNAQLVKVATATEKDIVVTEGEVTAITLKLAFVDPATAAGEGTFKWDIDGVELAQILSMTITDLTDDTTKPAIDLLDDDPDAKAETALDAGFYLVTVTAQKNLLTAASGADIAVWTDVLHVYNGLTTSVKLADADFAYSSNITGVWVNGTAATAAADGSFSYKLPAASADDKITIKLTSGTGAVFIPADGEDTLSGALGELPMVFADYEEDLTAATTEWTITEEGAYTLTITPWPLDEATLLFRNDDIAFMKVTFYDDVTERNQLGEVVEVPEGGTVPAGSFPNDAMDDFTITSWKTESGAAFTATTVVTADIDVFVNTKTFTGGPTPFVINNPEFSITPGSTHGTWDSRNTPASGKSNTFTIKTGGVRFAYADIEDPEFDIADYDFVTIDYTASGVNSVVYKYYNSGTDYPHTGSINTGTGEVVFEIRYDTTGFAFQKWSAGASDMEITFNKITFTGGLRHTVTFDPGDGGTVTPPIPAFFVDGTAVGSLPAATKGPNDIFMGWKLGSTVITTTTVVDDSFANATLTADWRPRQTLAAIPITFANASELTAVGGTPTISGNGYEFVMSGQWDGAWVKFEVDLPTGTILADYDRVTFTIAVSGSDPNYKQIKLLAGKPLPASFSNDPANGVYDMSGDKQYSSGTQNMFLDINKGKAAALEGKIELSLYIRLPSGQTVTVTNIELKQND